MKTKFIIFYCVAIISIFGYVFIFSVNHASASITVNGSLNGNILNVNGLVVGAINSPGTCGAGVCPPRNILEPCDPRASSCNNGKFTYQILNTSGGLILSGEIYDIIQTQIGCDVHCKNVQNDCCYSQWCGGDSCEAKPFKYNFSKDINVGSLSPENYTLRVTAGCCSGSGTCNNSCTADYSFTITAPAFNFNITTNPTSGSVTRSNSVSTTVTVARTAGTGATVNLAASSLPTGVTASFSPTSCNPGTGSCASTLTLSANSTAPAITSDAITITGTSGSISDSATYYLTVVVPVFNFNITTNPTSGSVTRSNSVSTTVTVARTAGTGATVNLAASSLPTGVTASFSPTSCNPGTGSCASTLTLSANSTAPAITSDAITITGTSGSISDSATYYLTVVVPTVSCTITENPDSGIAPLDNVDLTATVGGTATGEVYYELDCNTQGTNYQYTHTEDIDNWTKDNACDFSTAGTYTVRARVTRQGATDTCTDTIVVSPTPTLSVALSANKTSWPHPLTGVILTANVSGTATGTINYTFYCDNDNDEIYPLTPPEPNHKLDATSTDPYSAPANTCNSIYAVPGTYTAKVVAERSILAAQDTITITVTNTSPTATNLSVVSSDQCLTAPYYSFAWTYSDSDDDDESQFLFQVDNNSNFSSPVIDRTINVDYPSPSSNNQTAILSTIPTSGYLEFDTRYYWRVKVIDEYDASSNWTSGSSFTTPDHHYPKVSFTNTPTRPNVNEDVQFTDTSTCYDDISTGSPCSTATDDSFSWTFTGGTPSPSLLEIPLPVKFTTIGNKNITLQVTDSDSLTCSKTRTINANYPPPTWKEIRPE